MRKLVFFLFVAFAFISFRANAQTQKIGHVNTGDIFAVLPDVDSVQAKLDVYARELDGVIKEMNAELEKKNADFEANKDKWSETVKESKQAELLDLYKRLQAQQQGAQAKYQQEQQKLYEPVQKKVKDAIDKVGKANNYTYILDLAAGNPVYVSETQGSDITPLVKKELGITK
ncbi:MAG: OmpH family outer membrane protein [Prevotellaceae bacterium]|jgi:outer membrane protein|nr:OmpH family outer membrane protein [Prevotellaceae bacterium]